MCSDIGLYDDKGAENKVRKPWRVRGQRADGYLGKKGKDSETAKPLKKKKRQVSR